MQLGNQMSGIVVDSLIYFLISDSILILRMNFISKNAKYKRNIKR